MHLGITVHQVYAYNLNVYNNAHEIGKNTRRKNIGFIIDLKIEFDKHINQKMCFKTLNINNVVHLYKALVWNHLHYAKPILVKDPHCKKIIYLGMKWT